MFKVSLCLLLIGAFTILNTIAADTPVVDTSAGKVRGNEAESRDGRKYYQFLGVPYAKAERFQPPTKPESWTDIKDATNLGSVCPQLEIKFKPNQDAKFIGSENCLNVNVYTPKLPQNGEHKVLLPVLVWFASGGFVTDSGNYYGAKYFMDTDSILVTVSYRVGPFGFLNLGQDSAAGNQGLKDQVEALKWVQENIEQFGGDKGRVTIFGQGSGGASVQYHLLSPLSKGLFHNAISQTGGSFAPWAFANEPLQQAKLLAKKLDCPVDTKENLITCFKSKKPEDFFINDSSSKFFFEYANKDRILWEPSVESVNTDKAFLTHNPFVLMNEGKVENKVPLIIGVNLLDGAVPALAKLLSNPEHLKKLNENWDEKVPVLLAYHTTATDSKAISKKIKDFYFDGKDVTPENVFRVMDVVADRFFFGPALNFAIKYSSIAPAYTYVITHEGQYSSFKLPNHKTNGTAYYDELQYEFPISQYDFPEIPKGSQEYDFSKKFVNLWASFAENGKPTKTWAGEKTWDKFDPAKKPISLYGIDSETKPFVIPEDMLKRHALWGEIRSTLLKAEEQDPPKETL